MNLGGLLTSAVNSNVGQNLVDAGAQKAVSEIWDRDGFGGEEVDSPTAKVAAPGPAPMEAAPTAAKPSRKKLVLAGGGLLLLVGIAVWARKGGK